MICTLMLSHKRVRVSCGSWRRVAAPSDTLDTTIAGTLAQAWQPGTAALLNAGTDSLCRP